MFRLQNAEDVHSKPEGQASAGTRLRRLRESLGLTIRDVENASHAIADHAGKQEYCIPLSRLSDIESKNVVPGIHKLCSLALIYRRSIDELLAYFDIDLPSMALQLGPELPWPRTGQISPDLPSLVEIPVMDPGFNATRTVPCLRHIQKWGLLPTAMVKRLAESGFSYALIGSDDWMMYPLLRPGTLVQIDPTATEILPFDCTSEYDRPIYFVETRDRYYCCWISRVSSGKIVLQPHPLSSVPPVVLRCPNEAEVVGRVIGIAMRLGESADSTASKYRA